MKNYKYNLYLSDYSLSYTTHFIRVLLETQEFMVHPDLKDIQETKGETDLEETQDSKDPMELMVHLDCKVLEEWMEITAEYF